MKLLDRRAIYKVNGPVGTFIHYNYYNNFEPEAPALQGRCSTRLSYRPIIKFMKIKKS